MIEKVQSEVGLQAGMSMGTVLEMPLKAKNTYRIECFDADGNLRWTDVVENLVTTQGKNDLLNKYFAGSAYSAIAYIGLIDGITPSSQSYVTGDTYGPTSSHTGWSENIGYSNAVRPSANFGGGAAAGSLSNSPVAVFNINASGTIAGAFIALGTAASSVGGTGGGAILYGEGAFSTGSRAVQSGDTLNFTGTVTVS